MFNISLAKNFTAIFLLISSPALAEVSSSLWQTTKSEHFIIYFQDVKSGFVEELIQKAEGYYQSILEDLGFRRFNFWSWDKRAKIYLYPDSESYLEDDRRYSWSGGVVYIKERTIKTFIGQENFFDSILPHELAHIIFREFVGLKTKLPLWLDEGVACSQEKTSLIKRMEVARSLVKQNMQIDLARLFRTTELSNILPNFFYAESASVIVFLIDQYGRERFLEFSRKIRDGTDWQVALLSAFQFKDLADLESKWVEYISR